MSNIICNMPYAICNMAQVMPAIRLWTICQHQTPTCPPFQRIPASAYSTLLFTRLLLFKDKLFTWYLLEMIEREYSTGLRAHVQEKVFIYSVTKCNVGRDRAICQAAQINLSSSGTNLCITVPSHTPQSIYKDPSIFDTSIVVEYPEQKLC